VVDAVMVKTQETHVDPCAEFISRDKLKTGFRSTKPERNTRTRQSNPNPKAGGVNTKAAL